MKKFIKIAMSLVLLLAPMAMQAQSAQEARKVLKQYCEEKNQDVPIKDGDDDAYYVFFGFEDDQMNIVYGVNTDMFAFMCKNKEKALEAVVEALASDEELLGVVAYLTFCDGSLAFIICDYNGDIKDEGNRLLMAFDKDDLKAIIKKAAEKE